jgi:hypothetical protein
VSPRVSPASPAAITKHGLRGRRTDSTCVCVGCRSVCTHRLYVIGMDGNVRQLTDSGGDSIPCGRRMAGTWRLCPLAQASIRHGCEQKKICDIDNRPGGYASCQNGRRWGRLPFFIRRKRHLCDEVDGEIPVVSVNGSGFFGWSRDGSQIAFITDVGAVAGGYPGGGWSAGNSRHQSRSPGCRRVRLIIYPHRCFCDRDLRDGHGQRPSICTRQAIMERAPRGGQMSGGGRTHGE